MIYKKVILILTVSILGSSPSFSLGTKPVKELREAFIVKKSESNFQDTLTWKILNNLEYKEAEHETYGSVYLPEFAAEISKFANKKVIIKGYIIPVDKKTYALSKNVYAACFFCGKAGPETIMGLNFKEDPGRIKMDSNALLSGYFRLNGSNVDDWMYSLDEVEIINIK